MFSEIQIGLPWENRLAFEREDANNWLLAAYAVSVSRKYHNALLNPRLWNISPEAQQKTQQQQTHS